MEAHREQAVRAFFDYFRRRLEAVRWLDDRSPDTMDLTPDQHILLGAGLDAMAMHWGASTGGAFGDSAAWRMDAFCRRHTGREDVFDRLSLPTLHRAARERDKDKQVAWLPLIEAKFPRNWQNNRVRELSEDPMTDEVVRALVPDRVPEAWLRRSSLGGVLYTEHRCQWLHESDEGNVKSFSFTNRPDPHYAWSLEPFLVLPRAFLLGLFEHAITSFEAECLAQDVVPAAIELPDDEP